jgi:acyl-CoA synthetase (AMP-forming)/AMP-acid ligase II
MKTLVEIVGRNADQHPDALAYALVRDGMTVVEQLSYHQLATRARAVSATLQQATAPGERALLLCKHSLDFAIGFLGCVLADVIAVPAYPPRANRSFFRLRAIVADAQPRLALTSSDLLPRLTRFRATDTTLADFPALAVDDIPSSVATTWRPVAPDADTPAFLQYTSGSTSTPKGVIVSHRNLLENLTDLDTALHHTAASVMVSWLPLFHDMGLIYGALQPLFGAFPCYLMSPEEFVSRPLRWLQAISHFRGTHSAAPNFAYDLCVSTLSDEDVATLDLSSWVFAGNAAEPIKRQTVEQFSARFSPQGFRRTAFCFCYGLAESTLDTTRATVGEEPRFLAVQGKALEQGDIIEAAPSATQVRWLADCGAPSIRMLLSSGGQPASNSAASCLRLAQLTFHP